MATNTDSREEKTTLSRIEGEDEMSETDMINKIVMGINAAVLFALVGLVGTLEETED